MYIDQRSPVFQTPWFDLIAKKYSGDQDAHYSIKTGDYVCVLAVTSEGFFPLVRQFRPAIEMMSLELPSGHVEKGESPEQAGRRELLEETGYCAAALYPLGVFSSDPGRLWNRMWCFFAAGVSIQEGAAHLPEPGIELQIYTKTLRELIQSEPEFCSALNRAAILMAISQGHVVL